MGTTHGARREPGRSLFFKGTPCPQRLGDVGCYLCDASYTCGGDKELVSRAHFVLGPVLNALQSLGYLF